MARAVQWLAAVPHEQAIEEMSCADVLAFTSLQEGTPHVVLEALSLGLPVVCHDCCGMQLVVSDRCGIKIQMKDPEASIRGFTDAIRKLARDPALIEELSRGALARARELTWDHLADRVATAYEQVLSEKTVEQTDERAISAPQAGRLNDDAAIAAST
jgi:glycosyltransferase involved in cell wall biosynthesis